VLLSGSKAGSCLDLKWFPSACGEAVHIDASFFAAVGKSVAIRTV
jgi:hypothetical protein